MGARYRVNNIGKPIKHESLINPTWERIKRYLVNAVLVLLILLGVFSILSLAYARLTGAI